MAAAAADKAEAVKACAQLELDTAELRERVARHERTQACPHHAHRGCTSQIIKQSMSEDRLCSMIQSQSSKVEDGSYSASARR